MKSRPICIVNTFSGWKPGSTCCSFAKLRSINPAPIRRRNDTATCATISKLLIRCLPRPITDCAPPSFKPPTTVSRAASAGAVPDSMLVRTATPSVNSSTGASRRISRARGVNRAAKLTSKLSVPHENKSPKAPPISASSELSVSNCRNILTRPAPSAARTASSRSRRTMRERFKFATLAHAISRTKPAAPSSTSIVGRALCVSSTSSEDVARE